MLGIHHQTSAVEILPAYLSIIFGVTTIATVGLFYKAANNSRATLVLLLAWLIVQTVIGVSGFYTVTNTTPPRFLLLILPPLIFIIVLFATEKGRLYIDQLNIRWLTILHLVRLPVEVVLFWLFLHNAVPRLMTFEGSNFDILSGITAPVVFYFALIKQTLSRTFLLFWNFICFGLVINIVVLAALSAPFPFQVLALGQPNIAVLYFPFFWLPCCIVPLVLLSHAASIKQLLFPRLSLIDKIKN